MFGFLFEFGDVFIKIFLFYVKFGSLKIDSF